MCCMSLCFWMHVEVLVVLKLRVHCTQWALPSNPPLSPWFSWPVSICLHQSYQLTLGLDSSMPTTPSPPYIPPSLHLSIHPTLLTSAMQCCHCKFLMFNFNNHTAHLSIQLRYQTVHKGRALSTFLSLNFRCQKYYYKATYSYPLV